MAKSQQELKVRKTIRKYLCIYVIRLLVLLGVLGASIGAICYSYNLDGRSDFYVAKYTGLRYLFILADIVILPILLSPIKRIALVLADLYCMEFCQEEIIFVSSFLVFTKFHSFHVIDTKRCAHCNKFAIYYVSLWVDLFSSSKYYLDNKLTHNKKNSIHRLKGKHVVSVTYSKYAHIIVAIN